MSSASPIIAAVVVVFALVLGVVLLDQMDGRAGEDGDFADNQTDKLQEQYNEFSTILALAPLMLVTLAIVGAMRAFL